MKEIRVKSGKRVEAIDVTDELEGAVKGVGNGILFVFVPHCTAALIVNEFEPKIKEDYEKFFSKLYGEKWRHDEIDDNAAAHLASSVTGVEKWFFVEKGKLVLGTWQRVILVELDGPRERKLLCETVER